MKKITLLISLITVCILINTNSFAQHKPGSSASYVICDGKINFSFARYYNGGTGNDDDGISSMNLAYKTTSGSYTQIGTFSGVSFNSYCTPSGGTLSAGLNGANCSNLNVSGTDFGFTINSLPADAAQPVQLRYTYDWRHCYNVGDHNDNGYTDLTPIYYQTIEKHTALTATTDQCGKVVLTWSNPTQAWEISNSCGPQTYYTDIYRDGVKVTGINQSLEAYTDSGISGGSHIYKLKRTVFVGSLFFQSDFSVSASGNIKPGPQQATSLSASSDKCDNTIEINWDYNYDNPVSFLLKRSTSLNGTYTDWAVIDANERTFLDDSLVTRGTRYYYILLAKNDCNTFSANSKTNGISPADPAVATNVTLTKDTINNKFIIKWKDNATNESKYSIERLDNTGNTASFNVNANDTTFTDDNVGTCKLYKYKLRVYNSCVQTGLLGIAEAQGTLPPPNLAVTFDANTTKKLTGSKGYFNNRVELTWANNNTSVLNTINVYRKVLGSFTDSAQITSVTAGNTFFIDNQADAGVFYKYTIVGVSNCNGSNLYSNASEDVGFRNPTGIINGHIEYDGGVAVKDVKVSIERTTGSSGFALTYDGIRVLSTPSTPKLSTTTAMTTEAWVRFSDVTNSHDIVGKDGSFYLYYTGSGIQMEVYTNHGNRIVFYPKTGGAFGNININEYNHICGVFDSTGVKLYLNGIKVASNAGALGDSITPSTYPLDFGGRGSYRMNGYMDEIRVWNLPRTDAEVKRDYERVLNGDEYGLVALYHADENNGNWAYDVSKTGNVFNAHHAQFTGTTGNVWSPIIPTSQQMGYFGYTNAGGDYAIPAVRYNGNGENFKVTPSLGVHTFAPSNKVLFIGDGAAVHNGIDFIDKSSFRVQGQVKYVVGSCFVKGAYLNIDGSIVIKNGQPVSTNDTGKFDMRVPIGEHVITVTQSGHTYSAGTFPPTGVYNFQAPVSGIQFRDTTLVKVIGRVVGGTKESAKPMILGRSKNNIGVAHIQFNATNGCYTNTTTTVDSSGDYVAYLPPLKYDIANFSSSNVSSTNSTTFLDPVFINNKLGL